MPAMTFQPSLDRIGTNKKKFVQFLNEITIANDDTAALVKRGRSSKGGDYRGLVRRRARQRPGAGQAGRGNRDIEIWVFLRDKNPDVRGRYQHQGLSPVMPSSVL